MLNITMLLLDMAVQGVSATENSITFAADESVSEVNICNVMGNAFLVHHHPAFRPFTSEFDFTTSYNSVLVAQVDREQVSNDGHTTSYARNHPSTDIWLLFRGTCCIFQ